LVFIKKNNQTEILFFLKKTEIKPKLVQTDWYRFSSVRFLRQKPIQTGLARFFLFWLGFFGFGSVFATWLGFSGLARFFLVFFGLGSVRFGIFGFGLIKSKPNLTNRFFKILIGLIGFFHGSVFSVIIFSVLSI
jgi:hypothetical protein